MSEVNTKGFAIDKVNEIKQLCNDLKYVGNKQLRIIGIERIYYLADGILEHLEYLELKVHEEGKDA